MNEDVPERLKTAAVMQLVSGLINVFMMTWIVSATLGLGCGTCTGGMGGQCCGLMGCLLIPIGIFEIVSGVMTLTNPREGGRLMGIASYVELASVIAGGLPSAVVGFLVMQWLREPEVASFLASDEP